LTQLDIKPLAEKLIKILAAPLPDEEGSRHHDELTGALNLLSRTPILRVVTSNWNLRYEFTAAALSCASRPLKDTTQVWKTLNL
jgi:hypothetical protein